MQQPPRRSRAAFIFATIALLELAALVAVVTFRTNVCSIVGYAQTNGATLRLGGAGGGDNDRSQGPGPTPAPLERLSASPLPSSSAVQSGAAGAGDVQTQGDVNQVPDPNCVAKAAVDVLNSSPAPSTVPSCLPMSPPPALKNAEQQIQSGSIMPTASP